MKKIVCSLMLISFCGAAAVIEDGRKIESRDSFCRGYQNCALVAYEPSVFGAHDYRLRLYGFQQGKPYRALIEKTR
jgi:hypothetical protein